MVALNVERLNPWRGDNMTIKSKRYLKIMSEVVWATDNLTKDDLARLKDGSYDLILDLEEWKRFDPDTNSWVEIEEDLIIE